ncbi:hypothetical protein B0H16DRAFT_1454759 [Mycena metata]|uniref:Uncharacterized protein n=1 Tax=Mycena metata TaxID=1033252 RepID=A0AAD7JIM1_9AGAR|nr:hypothetical protein B0H16DRAFT_1454759 [Mycena metata]
MKAREEVARTKQGRLDIAHDEHPQSARKALLHGEPPAVARHGTRGPGVRPQGADLHVFEVDVWTRQRGASCRYDRYWMGRTAWTDIIRNARTMGRLIWYHIPLRLTPAAPGTGTDPRTPHELGKVMAEKRMALDLVEAWCFSATANLHVFALAFAFSRLPRTVEVRVGGRAAGQEYQQLVVMVVV